MEYSTNKRGLPLTREEFARLRNILKKNPGVHFRIDWSDGVTRPAAPAPSRQSTKPAGHTNQKLTREQMLQRIRIAEAEL
jgi:hypothetical protein